MWEKDCAKEKNELLIGRWSWEPDKNEEEKAERSLEDALGSAVIKEERGRQSLSARIRCPSAYSRERWVSKERERQKNKIKEVVMVWDGKKRKKKIVGKALQDQEEDNLFRWMMV